MSSVGVPFSVGEDDMGVDHDSVVLERAVPLTRDDFQPTVDMSAPIGLLYLIVVSDGSPLYRPDHRNNPHLYPPVPTLVRHSLHQVFSLGQSDEMGVLYVHLKYSVDSLPILVYYNNFAGE